MPIVQKKIPTHVKNFQTRDGGVVTDVLLCACGENIVSSMSDVKLWL